ncbi:MAG: hypothetical protein ACR2O5_06725, partial [Thiogranum sp.]
MADQKLSDLTPLGTDVPGTAIFEITTAGVTRSATRDQVITAALQAAVDANTAKVSASGSVTTHSDVSDPGSGQIITATERANITGSVTVHADVSDAGSGAIITTAERNAITANSAKVSADGSIDTHSDVTTGAKTADDVLTWSGAAWVSQAPAAGGAGTYNEVEKDDLSVSVGRAKLNFEATGDATVTVTDEPGGDKTTISIDATAGGGGGGIGKGAPFVVGDLLQVQSDAGDGTAQSAGIAVAALATQASLDTHTGDATIHYTQASIDHTAIANIGTNSHAQIDTHIGDATVHFTEASIVHNNISGRSTADAHPTSAITGLDAALASKLGAVADDPAPTLGGDLNVKSFNVIKE